MYITALQERRWVFQSWKNYAKYKFKHLFNNCTIIYIRSFQTRACFIHNSNCLYFCFYRFLLPWFHNIHGVFPYIIVIWSWWSKVFPWLWQIFPWPWNISVWPWGWQILSWLWHIFSWMGQIFLRPWHIWVWSLRQIVSRKIVNIRTCSRRIWHIWWVPAVRVWILCLRMIVIVSWCCVC